MRKATRRTVWVPVNPILHAVWQAFKHDELAVMREIVQVYGDLLKEITHRDFKESVRISEANIDRIVRRKAEPELEAA